ncbi:MAG: SulP family inorganic anion transporter [Deltaproteobacteria bacterium]|nr:SulP family inorganic anion transporter [Deltaproteobacteria bacterium]
MEEPVDSRDSRGWCSICLPFLKWWPRVTPTTLRADLIAGLTGAILALPQGVAFATIAGMPPQYGLYAGMVPAIVAALFGSSWQLVSGPTTAASLVLFSSLSKYAVPGSAEYVQLALTLTIMVGLIELAMGLARLGALVNFISHSVVIGFTAGAALLIASSQLKHFFGIEMPRGGHFHQTVYGVASQWADFNPHVVAVGLAAMISGLLVRRFLPKVPYMIVAMLVGCAVSFGLSRFLGVDDIPMVGALPSSLPPLSSPHFTLSTIRDLTPPALAMTLFALTEAVSIARSLAVKTGQDLDGNQEFVGQGLSNMVGSFFSGYVSTGSFNRSGLNFQAGARTPLAAIFAGVLLIVVVLFVAPYASYLPNGAMAGILFLVAWGLIDFHHIKRILKTSRADSAILVVTFLATLFLELEFAIFFGVLLSLMLYLNQTSHPRVLSRVPDPRSPHRAFTTDPLLPECPQLKIIRIDGSLFFGAINHVQEQLRQLFRASSEQKNFLLIFAGVNFVDMAGADFIVDLIRKEQEKGERLYLCEIKKPVLEALHQSGNGDILRADNVFELKNEAVAAIFKRLDRDICARCQARIFLECRDLPIVKEDANT